MRFILSVLLLVLSSASALAQESGACGRIVNVLSFMPRFTQPEGLILSNSSCMQRTTGGSPRWVVLAERYGELSRSPLANIKQQIDAAEALRRYSHGIVSDRYGSCWRTMLEVMGVSNPSLLNAKIEQLASSVASGLTHSDIPIFSTRKGEDFVSRNHLCGLDGSGDYRWEFLSKRARSLAAALDVNTSIIGQAKSLVYYLDGNDPEFADCWSSMVRQARGTDVSGSIASIRELASGTCRTGPGPSGPNRAKVIKCIIDGNWSNEDLSKCAGSQLDQRTAHACFTGGICIGEAATGDPSFPIALPKGRLCGAASLPPCKYAQRCGDPETIACHAAPSCGNLGAPLCNWGRACGSFGTLDCPSSTDDSYSWRDTFAYMNGALRVGFSRDGISVEIARPPLPNEQELTACRNNSASKDEFMRCIIARAAPREYQIAADCAQNNKADAGRAYVCSTGNPELLKSYDKIKQFNDCRTSATDNWGLAECAGEAVLDKDQQYYLSCITKNKGAWAATIVCAIAKDLTTEQQIALACAIQTGGAPYPFLVCTGGQLLQRELEKCWQNGIGTKEGCFGPNNDFRKMLAELDRHVERALGKNSDAYKAYRLWQDNVLSPGPNHDAIRGFNTALKDLRDGPGKNNDLVKAGTAVGEKLRSVFRF